MLKSPGAEALRIEYLGASGNLCAKNGIFSASRNVLFFSMLCLLLVLYVSKNAVIHNERLKRSIGMTEEFVMKNCG